jgi:hypothetical protein
VEDLGSKAQGLSAVERLTCSRRILEGELGAGDVEMDGGDRLGMGATLVPGGAGPCERLRSSRLNRRCLFAEFTMFEGRLPTNERRLLQNISLPAPVPASSLCQRLVAAPRCWDDINGDDRDRTGNLRLAKRLTSDGESLVTPSLTTSYPVESHLQTVFYRRIELRGFAVIR